MTKTKVEKILLIGLGSIGLRHARLLKELFPRIYLIGLSTKKQIQLDPPVDYFANNFAVNRGSVNHGSPDNIFLIKIKLLKIIKFSIL